MICWQSESETNTRSIIFINNFAFTADLECKIKLLLSELSEGTRIISTKPYAHIDPARRVTKRRLESAGSE